MSASLNCYMSNISWLVIVAAEEGARRELARAQVERMSREESEATQRRIGEEAVARQVSEEAGRRQAIKKPNAKREKPSATVAGFPSFVATR